MKSDFCYEYKTSEKGYFYYLKKNCQARERFKGGFPTVHLFSDEIGLRTGKKVKKNPNNKNVIREIAYATIGLLIIVLLPTILITITNMVY